MPKFSVKKPFTILVAVIAAVTLGIVSLVKMQLDLLPEVSLPYLMVIVTYPGASSEKVEAEVIEPLESALGTVTGVENVYGVCSENYGIVQLEFADDTDLDSAMVKVSSAINTIESSLPDDCGTPSIMELGTDLMASMYLAISSDGMPAEELSQFVDDTIQPAFERQEGVASVTALGLVEKTIQVELDQEKVDDLNDRILASLDDSFAEALEQLDDAKAQLSDSEKEISKSKKKLVDSQQDLVDGRQELIDGQKELDDNRNKLADSQATLEDSKRKLEEGKKTLNEKKNETYAGLAALSDALDQYNSYKTQLTNQQAQQTAVAAIVDGINAALPGLEAAAVMMGDQPIGDEMAATMAALNLGITGSTTYNEALTLCNNKKNELAGQASEIATNIMITQGIISKYEEQFETYKTKLGLSEVSYAAIEKAKLDAATMFGSSDAQLEIGKAQLESAQASLDSGKESLKSAQEQLDKGWDTLKDGEEQINDGWKSLRDGEEKIRDGWDDYNDAVRTYEKQKAEAIKKANADQLLNLPTLAQLIYAQNFEMPAGYIDDELDNSWLVKVGQKYEQVSELEDIVLTNIHKVGDIKLGDVANITVIDNSNDSYVRLGADKAVILSIFKGSTSGTNDVSKAVKATIAELEEKYEGLNVAVLVDQGDYINLIVNSVLQSMAIGALLAIIILAIFLKDVKPTLVVAISIPLSVLLALVAMYFSNISLNMLSLSGLALGIGMLVDNSIVVIENIYRLRGRGVEAPRAAVQGTKQVAGAIIASTLTTACVFLPMIYTTGLVSELMGPMCLTIVYCLVASLLIAMTVAPTAASTVLRNAKPKEHPFLDKVQDAYGSALDFCLKKKWIPLVGAIGLLIFSCILVINMGIVVIPDMTMNQMDASIEYPEEMTQEECYAMTDQVMDRLLQVEGIGSLGVMDGGQNSLYSESLAGATRNFRETNFFILTENENAGADEINRIIKDMQDAVADLDCGFQISTASSEMSQLTGGTGLSINVYGDDLDKLSEVSHDIMDIVGTIDGFAEIDNGEEDVDQTLHLIVDKNKAMSMGLSVAQIYQELYSKIDTDVKSVTVTIDDINMDIVIVNEMEPLTKENLLDYSFRVNVYDEDDDQVTEDHPLSDFATISTEDGAATIRRLNQTRYVTVTAAVEDGYNVTLLTRQLEPLLEKYDMPSGYSYKLGGEYDSVITMVKQMSEVIALGLLFIYLVMVAQFQSLLSPFIVLFTVPLAFTGGFLSLWITRENMSVISMMGLIVLMGTVVNNGIVFVDYTNQLRKSGMDRRNALIATGKTRMRPILMTALTTILAESNLMFGDDMGAQLGRGMALVIAGGLLYATLMTLFVIPVMYDILFKKQPLDIDTGSESLDDIPDDAQEYMAEMAAKGLLVSYEDDDYKEKDDSKEENDSEETDDSNGEEDLGDLEP